MRIKTGDLVIPSEVVRSILLHEEQGRHAYRVLSITTEEPCLPMGLPARYLRLQHVLGTKDFAFSAFEGHYHVWKSHEEVIAERLMS